MGRISNPATVSTEFGIADERLSELGVVNVMLNTDTLLFIDPMLLPESRHPEIGGPATEAYRKRFETVIKLLNASSGEGDVAWRAAERLFRFSEVSWTCLGYGASVRGAGFGKELITSTLETASQIVRLGVDDVDLFMVLALFEEGIGPDRISDMTTNIILRELISLTQRVNQDLQIPPRRYQIGQETLEIPINPYSGDPLILVPTDIVRDLPLACDWSDISRVVNENEQLRERVNNHVGSIWASMTRREKRQLKDAALRSKAAFEQMLEVIKSADPSPYDFRADRNGEAFWAKLIERIPREHPFSITGLEGRPLDIDAVESVVKQILAQFRDLVENKGIWKELWTESGQPRKEKGAQRLFYVIAYAYCKANNLDLTPEADSGNGPVDFKVSKGFAGKVVIEIKLSTGNVVHGYEKQLEVYKRADDTDRGVFLLIDIGGLGQKYNEIQRIRAEAVEAGASASAIWYVDATKKASASKRT